jgi:hypothetical protein
MLYIKRETVLLTVQSWVFLEKFTITQPLKKMSYFLETITVHYRVHERPHRTLCLNESETDIRLSWISSVPPGKCWEHAQKQSTTVSSTSFSINYSLIIIYSTDYNIKSQKLRYINQEYMQ